jgi:4-hydroxy-4-methyl-2-oxoglutarate aldolase
MSNYSEAAEFKRVSPEQIARARKYQAAILCDVAGRRGTLDSRIQALHPNMRVVGPAFPVEVRPGDNLMFHVALAVAKPGDIIVVDGKADSTCALFGELMVTQAAAARLGGFVVDAASRDTDTLANGSFPVFSAGRNPCGPTKSIPGTLGKTIALGGVAVSPGDLVVGDIDGVVVIPYDQVDAVLEAAENKVRAEKTRLDEIARGELVSPWLNDALRSAGLPALGNEHANPRVKG